MQECSEPTERPPEEDGGLRDTFQTPYLCVHMFMLNASNKLQMASADSKISPNLQKVI